MWKRKCTVVLKILTTGISFMDSPSTAQGQGGDAHSYVFRLLLYLELQLSGHR